MSKYLFRVFNVGRSLYPGYLYIGKREKKCGLEQCTYRKIHNSCRIM